MGKGFNCCIKNDSDLRDAETALFSATKFKGLSGDELNAHIRYYRTGQTHVSGVVFDSAGDMPHPNKAKIRGYNPPYSNRD